MTDKSFPVKPPRKLTRKQQAFIKHLVSNPKDSATEAAAKTYDVTTRQTAEQIASENLRKPLIIAELEKYDLSAQSTIIKVMQRSEAKMMSDETRAVDWAVNARQTADSILDRLHGKATQKTESTSTAVTINVDLTGNVLSSPVTDTDNT